MSPSTFILPVNLLTWAPLLPPALYQSLLLKQGVFPSHCEQRSLLQAYIKLFHHTTAFNRYLSMGFDLHTPIGVFHSRSLRAVEHMAIDYTFLFCFGWILAHSVCISISFWVIFNHIKYKRFFICHLNWGLRQSMQQNFQIKESNSWYIFVFGQSNNCSTAKRMTLFLFLFFLQTLKICHGFHVFGLLAMY